MGFKVAVVGATGNVGREMLSILAEREFPADDVFAIASSQSIGKQVSFGEDDVLDVQALDNFDFKGVDIVLSSPGAKVSAEFAPRAAKAGAVVIAKRHLTADRARRRERDDLVARELALGQGCQHLAPDIAGRAHDRYLEAHESTPSGSRIADRYGVSV